MEAELKDKFGADVTLVPGSGGVYDVVVDGRQIFSKGQAGRFPEEGEIETLIRGM